MVHYLGDLEENMLEISNEKGDSQVVPIVGMFKNDNGYYIVLQVTENDKEEYVMYKVIKRADGSGEYIQVITDQKEWNDANESWNDLNIASIKQSEIQIL